MAEILDENTRLRELTETQAGELATQSARLSAQAAQLLELQAKLETLQSSHELLTKHFEFLEQKRKLAAAERFIADENQFQLFNGAEVTLPPRDAQVQEEDKARSDEPTDKRKTSKHARKGRRNLADLKLPKVTVNAPVNAPPCDQCGKERPCTHPKVSHRIAWKPGHFYVMQVQQEQRACSCPDSGVWTAPPPFLLPNSMCDDALLARVVIDKFGEHVPLNRQAKRMTREGFPVGNNVLAGWVKQGTREVKPLVRAVHQQIASSLLLMSDDTGFPVQDGSDGKLANGRLWVVTDQKQALFAFSRTKEGVHPAELLANLGIFERTFVADGGSEYNQAEADLELERAGCWSHLRRYFRDASIQHDEAKIGLVAIHDVFMIERDLVELPVADRLETREVRSKPVVDGFFEWVKTQSQKERPKSKLGRALGYAISQEARLRVFLSNGRTPIHNNLSELLLRQPVVGRKNWLFAGSEGGAEAAADWFTLIASCLLQGIDPATYLYDVFRRLPAHPSKWVHELTPLNWRLAVEAGDIEPLSPGRLV